MFLDCLSSPIIDFLLMVILTGRSGRDLKSSEHLTMSDWTSRASHNSSHLTHKLPYEISAIITSILQTTRLKFREAI